MSRGTLFRLALLAILWGSGFLFVTVALRSLSPVQLTLARLSLGAAVLVPFVILRDRGLPRGRRVWAHLAVAALLANVLPYLLFAFAQEELASGLAGSINATTPLWALAFEIAAGARRIGPARLAGLAVGFAGTFLIFAPWESGAGVATWPAITALVASASYGLSYVYQHRFLVGRGDAPMSLAAGQLAAATGLLCLAVPVAGLQPIHLRTDAVLALVVLGTLGTGVAYVINFRLIADQGPAASIVSYLIPVVALILGVLVLRERLILRTIGGVAVVLAGVAVATATPSLAPRRKEGTGEARP